MSDEDTSVFVYMAVANVMGTPMDIAALSQTCRAARAGVYKSTVWSWLCAGCDLVNVDDERESYTRFVMVRSRLLRELSVLGMDALEQAYNIGSRRLTERSYPIAWGIINALGIARRRLSGGRTLMNFVEEFAIDTGSSQLGTFTHLYKIASSNVSTNELVGPATTAMIATYSAVHTTKQTVVVVVDSSADFRMIETVCRELVPETLVWDWDCSSEEPDGDAIPGFKQLRLINSSSIVLVDQPVFVEYYSLDTVLEVEDVAVITTNSMQFRPSRSRRIPLHVQW